jgi:polysaccharide biosynthesis/export protein
MRLVLFFVFCLVTFCSCIPNRKIVYFQKDDVNKKYLSTDSSIRSYTQVSFDYKVQTNDALYVNIKSITNRDYDFLNIEGQNNIGNAGGNQAFIVNSELVDAQGNISFPVIGNVQVAGKNIFEIQEQLQILANNYLESAIVKVRLVNFRFTILGEVLTEGTVTTLNNRITLPEAIGLAGGIGELADRTSIKIIRQSNGQATISYINLLDENILSSSYYFINQGDIIVVPALRQRPYRKYFGQNLSLVIASLTLLLTIVNLSN